MIELAENTFTVDEIRTLRYQEYRQVLSEFTAQSDAIALACEQDYLTPDMMEDFERVSLEFMEVQTELRKYI